MGERYLGRVTGVISLEFKLTFGTGIIIPINIR